MKQEELSRIMELTELLNSRSITPEQVEELDALQEVWLVELEEDSDNKLTSSH